MPVQSCVRVIPEVCWLGPTELINQADPGPCIPGHALQTALLLEILAQSHYGLPKISQRSMWERPCNNM